MSSNSAHFAAAHLVRKWHLTDIKARRSMSDIGGRVQPIDGNTF
jgi:hypothetical protein